MPLTCSLAGRFSVLFVALLCLTLATIVLVTSVRNLRGTTLLTAGGWSCAGLIAWWVAVLCGNLGLTSRSTADLLFYLASVLLLCPGIAVLGARRPGHVAWNFFVLLPLVAVLLWPAVASAPHVKADAPLDLESPAAIGFVLVVVMGTGNYFGTRFTLPAMLHTVSLLLITGSMWTGAADLALIPERETARHLAAISFMLAVVVAALRAGESVEGLSPLDRLWLDFVDQFGLVWAKRVMDRLNEAAGHENWSAEFQWHRIQRTADTSAEEATRTEIRIEHTMRWLLKRFVEPEWIDSRFSQAMSSSDHGDPKDGETDGDENSER